ncbi:MAG TPA: hypothetical protein VGA55_07385 [Bacteroidota bacterium]
MNNLTKILLGAGAAALVVWLVMFLSLNSRLNEAIDRLESAQGRIDSSLTTLAVARVTIDSVRSDLTRFSKYIRDIQMRVEILDLNERSGNDRFRSQRESIIRRLRELYNEIQMTGKDLPEIPIVGG